MHVEEKAESSMHVMMNWVNPARFEWAEKPAVKSFVPSSRTSSKWEQCKQRLAAPMVGV